MKSKPVKKVDKDSAFLEDSNEDRVDFNHIANDVDFVIFGNEAKAVFDKIENPAKDRVELRRKVANESIQTFEKYNHD